MRSRLLWRRTATAAGVYSATVFGFLTTVVATRMLGPDDFALYATVVAATAFLQLLLDLTVEEALVKYGFRYATVEDWGRFRRVFELSFAFKLVGGLIGGLVLAGLAPFADEIWGEPIAVPLLFAALVPLFQAPENIAAAVLMLRGRYDLRGWFYASSMALRLTGVAIGAHRGVAGAMAGFAAAQLVATSVVGTAGLIAFRRFPRVPSTRLQGDRREFRAFVVSSTFGSSLVSARQSFGTALMSLVAPSVVQAGYYSNAQAPATGFSALSAPARLVLLTEQTRDFEQGRQDRVYGMLRRYVVGTSLLMVAVVPVAWLLMPWLMQLAYGEAFRIHATTPARIVLIAAALQLVFGWAKSFPVSIGRPNLRLVAHGVEVAVFVPLVVAFGSRWGATGGAVAFLCSTSTFCALWTVLLLRLRREPRAAGALAR